MVSCKFCGQNEAIKKSHIIPEFMCQKTYDEKHRTFVYDAELEELEQRQKGYYEPLLCSICEQYFNSNFEQPSLSFVKKALNVDTRRSTTRLFVNKEVELLLLSILWRASQSKG